MKTFRIVLKPIRVVLVTALFGLAVAHPERSLAAVAFPVELLAQEAQFSNHLWFEFSEYANQVAISGDRAVATMYRRADLFVRENGVWRVQGTMTTPEGGDAIVSVALEGDTLVLGNPGAPPNSGAGRAYVYVRGAGPGLNAWNVTDRDSFAPSVKYLVDVQPAMDAAARTNGWRYRLVARMLDNFDIQGFSMDFLYGDGTNRYGAYLALNPDGNLVAGLLGASPQERILTTNTAGARDFHTHELVFHPTTRMVTYFFDGASNRTWAGQSHTNNGIFWGFDSTGGQGSMNVHQARFEILQTGTVLANYDAGTEGNPVVAPNPVSQGWSQLGTPGFNSPIGPQSPDPGTLWRLQGTLAASDGLGGADFCERLAISGNTVVVGARFDDKGGGSAYVFARNGTNWTQQRKLTPSVRTSGDYFGWSVDIDGETIVVGAPHFGGGGAFPGRAFVFVRTGTNWAQQPPSTPLTASDGAGGDRFGSAVAIDGDRIAVGAQHDAHGAAATFAGSAYVFERAGVTWAQRAKLVANPITQFEQLGSAIDLKGDTLIVGAKDAPAHYIFTRVSSNQWHQANRRLYPDNDDPSVSAVAFDGQRFMVGTIQIEGSDGVAHIFSADYSNAAGVKDYVRKWLYYPDAQTAAIPFDPNQSAFRYKHLLYGLETNRVRARHEMMSSLYGPTERDLAALAESQLLSGLFFNPNDAGLGNLLLDICYDRTVAETILAKGVLAAAERARFDSNSPTGFIIDSEIPLHRTMLATNRFALQCYFDLLKRELETQQPGGTNTRWASVVLGFSSQWTNDPPNLWHATQALGVPNTYPAHGDIETAWASLTEDDQREFLELGYANPAPINTVSVYETWNPGAVDKISVRNPDTGLWQEVWSGMAAPAGNTSRIFTVTFPLTAFPVSAIRIDINSPAVSTWNEIDAVSISERIPPGPYVDPAFGRRLFQSLVPSRALMAATYINTNGMNVPVSTNTMLFSGYKDVVLLFDLLRDHGRTAEALGRLLVARNGAGDIAEAKNLVSDAQRFLYLQGALLQSMFPSLPPEGDSSGVAEAILGWSASLAALGELKDLLQGRSNLLGFEPDFLMFASRITVDAQEYFDSFDSFAAQLDPAESTSPLGVAMDDLAAALNSYAAYRGFEDQLQEQFADSAMSFHTRLFEIVGAVPGDATYGDSPTNNPGSELDQQYRSIDLARLRIRKNDTSLSNLRQQIQIEIQRANQLNDAYIQFGDKRAALAEELAHVNAVQSGVNGLVDTFSVENLTKGGVILGLVNTVVAAGAEEWKGNVEIRKEKLAALEQATVEGINSAATVKTLLLQMNTLALDSQEAAILMQQELARMAALYREKAHLEAGLAERKTELSSRYFADPIHRLAAQNNMVSANLSFAEAQKWMFYLTRAFFYKWNTPFTNNYDGRIWNAGSVFKVRNADELFDLYLALDNKDATIGLNLNRQPFQTTFSVRKDFYSFLDGQTYVDPATGQTVGAIEAFRRRLRTMVTTNLTDVRLDIEFSTVREKPGSPFFLGPRFDLNGAVVSPGRYLDKIVSLQIKIPGMHSLGFTNVQGDLTYGGTSFIRRQTPGAFDPLRPDRLRNEMTAFSTRYWFHDSALDRFRFREGFTSSGVHIELHPDPNLPPAVSAITDFTERSVAASGWRLSLPLVDSGTELVRIDQIDDVLIFFNHQSVTRQ